MPRGGPLLLVVDMQDHYLASLGIEARHSLVGAVNELARGFRDHGAPVVWLRMVHDESWAELKACIGEPGWAERRRCLASSGLAAGVRAAALDLVVDKMRHDAFAPGSSRLSEHIGETRPSFVAVAGVSTHICCLATARGALAAGHGCVMVADALAAADPAEHRRALDAFVAEGGAVETAAGVGGRLRPQPVEH